MQESLARILNILSVTALADLGRTSTIEIVRRVDMYLSGTSIIGTSVQNAQGENLGTVEDLMIDTSAGEVSYAVLSFGGFLGVGDKLFAVPLQAMRVNTQSEKLILDESKDRLENAPGFDKEHWPDNADTKWQSDVRSYYRI